MSIFNDIKTGLNQALAYEKKNDSSLTCEIDPTIKQHFMNPMNMGKLKKYTNSSKFKSGFCGDTIEIYARIEHNIVKELKYQVFGCYALISGASIISDWAINKTITEVKNITLDKALDIMNHKIDKSKYNCIDVVVNALRNL